MRKGSKIVYPAGDVYAPPAETAILKDLISLGIKASVWEIYNVRTRKGTSVPAIYSLMRRLQERLLVTRLDVLVEVLGATERRVLWEPTTIALQAFAPNMDSFDPVI